jgi:hypothetical protein
MGLTLSNSFFSDLSSAVGAFGQSEMDTAQAQASTAQAAAAQTTAAADLLQGQGDVIEGQSYGEAASLATLNAQYTTASTAIQEAQNERQQYQVIGNEKAQVAGAGLASSGTAADLLRSSAYQGALNQQITGAQGQIQVAGYEEQAQSYTAMQEAAGLAAQAQTQAAAGEGDVAQADLDTASGYKEAASTSEIGGIISGIGAVASLFTGGIGPNLTGPSNGAGTQGMSGWEPALPDL